jgi:hypothetical protein
MADYNREWRCTTCGAAAAPTGTGYGELTNHPCSGKRKLALVDKDTGEVLATNLTQAISKGFIKKQGMEGTPDISPKGDASVLDGYKGYEQDKEAYLFIRLPDGKIRDFRLEFPEVLSLYNLCKKEDKIGYKGDFPHFMVDCVETMFALAGYDLLLAPRSLQIVYDEAARLVGENKLIRIFDASGQISKLEVNDNGSKDSDPKGGVQPGTGEHQPERLPAKKRKKEPGKSQ